MREILFRGKQENNGEWVYGLLTIDDFITTNGIERAYCIKEIPSVSGSSYKWVRVISETVGQYTGLTDKNGNKIFEGDILEFSDRLVEVFWHAHLGCWDCNFLKYTNIENGRDDMSPCRWSYRSKVVGNIHDNPELLNN